MSILAAAIALGSLSGAHDGRKLVVMIEEKGFESTPALERIARDFEREHPGLEVRVIDQSGAVGQQDKARFMLSGDLQLDVTRIDVTEFGAFHREGALIDIEPFLRADPSFREDDFLPVLDGFRADGRLFGLPSTFTPYVMYVNLDVLERADVAVPRDGWTWSDLLDACTRTTRDTDGDGRVDQWGISLTQWLQAIAPWIWQNGGELVDASGERSRIAEPEAVEAIAFLRALLHEHRVASFDATFEGQFSRGLFQAGRCAFYGPVGYWETYRFKHLREFRWDVLPLPRGKRAATAIAMTGYVVPRTAREPELAAKFIRRLAGPEYQHTLAEIGNGVPAWKAAAFSESFLSPTRAPASERVFLDVLDGARFLPALANWRKIESICQAELQGALLFERYDAAEACARIAEKTDAFLARERGRLAREPLPSFALELVFALGMVACLAAFAAARGRAPRGSRRADPRAAAWLLAPWAIGCLAFFVGPAAVSAALSLCEWSPLRGADEVRWLGGENYARLWSDDTFHASLAATATFAALSVPTSLALALWLAWILREDGARSAFLRTLIYLPAIVSPVVIAATWRPLLDSDRGPIDAALACVGIDGPDWLRSETWVVPAFALIALWSVGAQMLVFLAAIKARDASLEDAARVDGARAWPRFWHVVLPQLGPVLLFNAVLGVIAAFQIFAQAYVMTGGGPGDASRFLVLYLYESGFRHLDMGYASAIAWALVLVLAVACVAIVRASSRWIHYAGRRVS